MEKLITVCMIDSRSDTHPEWVQTAINSVKKQMLPVEMIVYNNIGRKKTIGQCLNELVKMAKTEWVFFLDDDDWISPDYLALMQFYINRNKQTGLNPVSVCTYMTVVNETGQEWNTVQRTHKGVIRRDYMLKHPWNEKLLKGFDREWFEEVKKRNDPVQLIHYHYGYHYRQHHEHRARVDGYIEITKEPGDIYINSRYAQHTTLLKEKLEEKYKVLLDDRRFNSSLAKDAKLLWCDWGDINAVDIGNYETDAPKILRIHAYEAFSQAIYHIPFDKYDKVIFVAEHIKEYVERQLNRKLEHAVVIPNGVDLNAFCPPENKERNNKIAYAGELSRKKGLQLMLFIAEHFPEYQFHVAGKFNEPDMAEYFMQRKPDNVILEPYSYDLNEFFKDKTYFLLTSPREGCNVTALQAMAAGLFPLIYNHVGAMGVFPMYSIWQDIDLLKAALDYNLPSMRHREFVKEHYDIDFWFEKYLEIIEDLLDGNIKSRNIKEGAAAG